MLFESYLDSSSEHTDDDGFYSFKWQFFELLNAREALLVSIQDGWCAKWITTPGRRVDTSGTLFGFDNIQELTDNLVRRGWDRR